MCCTRRVPFPYILENKVDSAEGKKGVFFLRTNEGKWSLCVNREERRGDRTRGEFRSNREEGGKRQSRGEGGAHLSSLFSSPFQVRTMARMEEEKEEGVL